MTAGVMEIRATCCRFKMGPQANGTLLIMKHLQVQEDKHIFNNCGTVDAKRVVIAITDKFNNRIALA